VVGLGTQDSLGEARDFVARYGTTFTMLWDESFRSWRQLGISGQPAAVLLAPDGTEIERWLGQFPEDEVVRLASRR
jgi:peroxiredoxin